jgi:hypothetical protein
MVAETLLFAVAVVGLATAAFFPTRAWDRFVLVSRARAAVRAEARRGPWQSFRGGARWYMFAPKARDLDLRALGACAWINRFGGHARTCSVAEHQVRCAEWCLQRGYSPYVQLQAGLHDVHEIAAPGDVIAPAYRGPWWISWPLRIWSRRVERVFRTALGLPWELHPAVHEADQVMLSTELHDRMPEAAREAWVRKLAKPLHTVAIAWDHEYAEFRWWSLIAGLAPQAATSEPGLTTSQRTRLCDLAHVAHEEARRLRHAEELP